MISHSLPKSEERGFVRSGGRPSQPFEGQDTIIFDAYGTIFDLGPLAARCDEAYPGHGSTISSTWRRKQLEDTWIRTLMNQYVDFETITREALESTLAEIGLAFTSKTIGRITDGYLLLKPFREAKRTLVRLESRVPLCILSNGSSTMVKEVIGRAGLSSVFEKVFSAEDVQCYKPDPRVYRLADRTNASSRSRILFVSGNEWDVAGAKSFGFRVAWVNRGKKVFSRWPRLAPDHQVTDLSGLLDIVDAHPDQSNP